MIKDGDFEVVKALRYKKEEKTTGNVGLEEIAKKLDIIKFMEARHDEKEENDAKQKDPMCGKKAEPTKGPLLISPRYAMDLTNNEQSYQPRASEVTFLLLGPGQIFGEEALLTVKEDGTGGLPLYSIRCKSAIGEVLIINEDDYTKRMICNPRTLRIVEDNCE